VYRSFYAMRVPTEKLTQEKAMNGNRSLDLSLQSDSLNGFARLEVPASGANRVRPEADVR